jgi:uncharacterized membrane protein
VWIAATSQLIEGPSPRRALPTIRTANGLRRKNKHTTPSSIMFVLVFLIVVFVLVNSLIFNGIMFVLVILIVVFVLFNSLIFNGILFS